MIDLKSQFSDIYDKYVDKIYRFVFLKVNSQEVCQDITSETFTRCWRKINDSKGKIDNTQAFLYQIARNLVIDHYREKGKIKIVSVENTPIIDNRTSLKEKTENDSDMEMIKAGLCNLNEDYQDLIILHYIEDLSVEEIAKINGKSEGAVRVTLSRALKSLKQELGIKEEGIIGERIEGEAKVVEI